MKSPGCTDAERLNICAGDNGRGSRGDDKAIWPVWAQLAVYLPGAGKTSCERGEGGTTRYDEEQISPRCLIMIELYGMFHEPRVKLGKRLYKLEVSAPLSRKVAAKHNYRELRED